MVKETRLYDILEVEPCADAATLKRKYRELARKYHPDRNQEGGELFKEISLAYATLTDPEKRNIYDVKGDKGLKKPCCKAPAYPDKTVSTSNNNSKVDKKQFEISKPGKRKLVDGKEGLGEQEKKFKGDHSENGHEGHVHIEDDNDDSEEEEESENEGEGESCPCCPSIGMSPEMMQKLLEMEANAMGMHPVMLQRLMQIEKMYGGNGQSQSANGPGRDHSGHEHSGHGHDHSGHGHDHSGHGHEHSGHGHDHSGHGHEHSGHGKDHSGHEHSGHGHDHSGQGHSAHGNSSHDHSGHDHSGHAHAGHDHSGHGHDHSGHEHSGHDHKHSEHDHKHSGQDHSVHDQVHVEDEFEDSDEEDESENEGGGGGCPCCPAIDMSPELMQKMMMMEMQMQMYGRYGGQGSQMFARPIAPGLQTQIRAGTAQVAAVPGGAAGMRQVRAQLAGGGQIVRQGGMAVQSPIIRQQLLARTVAGTAQVAGAGGAAGLRQVRAQQIVGQGGQANIIFSQEPKQGMAVQSPIIRQQLLARAGAGTAQLAGAGGAAGMRQVRAQLAGGGQIVRQGGMAVQSPGRAAGMRQVIRYVRQGDQIVRQGDLTNIINPQQPRQGMAVVRPIMGQQSVARTVSAVAGVSGVARESRWAPAGVRAGGRNMVQGEGVPGQLVMPNDIQMGPPPPPSHTVRPGPTGSS